MRLRRLAIAAVVVGLALVVATGAPAAAHATLVTIDPADGARLAHSPDQVTLTFSEQVSADGHPVRGGSVFGVGDVTVDNGASARGGQEHGWKLLGNTGTCLSHWAQGGLGIQCSGAQSWLCRRELRLGLEEQRRGLDRR